MAAPAATTSRSSRSGPRLRQRRRHQRHLRHQRAALLERGLPLQPADAGIRRSWLERHGHPELRDLPLLPWHGCGRRAVPDARVRSRGPARRPSGARRQHSAAAGCAEPRLPLLVLSRDSNNDRHTNGDIDLSTAGNPTLTKDGNGTDETMTPGISGLAVKFGTNAATTCTNFYCHGADFGTVANTDASARARTSARPGTATSRGLAESATTSTRGTRRTRWSDRPSRGPAPDAPSA